MDSTSRKLVNVVCRAHNLITQMQILSKSNLLNGIREYREIAFDFSYWKSAEAIEERIRSDSKLSTMDESFQEAFDSELNRFKSLFLGIISFHQDITRTLQEIQAGTSIHSSMDRILSGHGRQLLPESLHLHVVVFLLLHHLFPFETRERILIAILRNEAIVHPNIQLLRSLCRRTGSGPSSTVSFLLQWAHGYSANTESSMAVTCEGAEEYLARFPLPKSVIREIISFLMKEDVYSAKESSLSRQASMAASLLLYLPEDMDREAELMLTIWQRYFQESWVVQLYSGFSLDVPRFWEAHRGARLAISSRMSVASLRTIADAKAAEAKVLYSELQSLRFDSAFTEDYALKHTFKILGLCRGCNSSLKWMLVHFFGSSKRTSDTVSVSLKSAFGGEVKAVMLEMMLEVAMFEHKVQHAFTSLVETREASWKQEKATAEASLNELIEFFSGSQPVFRSKKNESLELWFTEISRQVASLDLSLLNDTVSKIQQIIAALKDVLHFHQINASLAIKQQVEDVTSVLEKMSLISVVNRDTFSVLSSIQNVDYALEFLPLFTPILQKMIANDPKSVHRLQYLFWKVATVPDWPLRRFKTDISPDSSFITQYYSERLLNYAHSVLDFIPKLIHGLLKESMTILADRLKPYPDRLDKESVLDYAQVEERIALAKVTNQMAVLSRGLITMQTFLSGQIDITPKGFLEQGIQTFVKEKISLCLTATFSPSVPEAVSSRLSALGKEVAQLKSVLEQVQDFLHANGRLVIEDTLRDFVEESTEKALTRIGTEEEEAFRSFTVGDTEEVAVNFMGVLFRWVLQLSCPKQSMYLTPLCSWFDASGKEQIGLQMIKKIHKSLGVNGLVGLDRLLHISAEMKFKQTMALLSAPSPTFQSWLAVVDDKLRQPQSIPDGGTGVYSDVISQSSSFSSLAWGPLLDCIPFLGQCLLLRRLVACQLQIAARVEAGLLTLAAQNLNLCVGGHGSDSNPYSSEAKWARTPSMSTTHPMSVNGEVDPLDGGNGGIQLEMELLSGEMLRLGLHSPSAQVFSAANLPDNLSLILFIFTMQMIPSYTFDDHLSCLVSRSKKSAMDCSSLVVGIWTILRQYHPGHAVKYVELVCQYLRVHKQSNLQNKGKKLKKPPEAENAIFLLLLFLRNPPLSPSMEAIVPSHLLL